MTQTHTPGPWELEAGRSIKTISGTFYLSYGSEPRTGRPHFNNFLELDANARLIAAAPETAAERDRLKAVNAELLASIYDFVSYCDNEASENGADVSCFGWFEVYSQARRTIAKATGRE